MLWKSEILKSVKIRCLLCVELSLLLIGIAGLFGKTGVVVGQEYTCQLTEEGVALPVGVYTLKLYYDAGENEPGYFELTSENTMFRSLLVNPVPLYSGISEQECQFYLLNSVERLRLNLTVAEDVRILGAEIVTGTEGAKIYLFWLLVICVPLNLLVLLYMSHNRHPIPAEKLATIFGIPLLALTASLPVMVDYNITGVEWAFHIERIEALAESIRAGELSVRLSSFWLNGHGYASSLFCGDTFLAIPVLLRLLGLDLSVSYRIFLIVVNVATAWTAYISFNKCFKNGIIGLFGSTLYTLAPYRLYDMYNRAAVGEFTAMIFLPLLVWGFYRIYTEDLEKKDYLWNWVIPVIGFSGIIQSHMLSCGMAGVFVALLCLLLWKRTFRKRTFLVLLCTVIMTIVVNAWFLIPFFDMMQADSYFFKEKALNFIQSRGIYLAQIFYTLQAAGVSSRYTENSMLDAEPIGMGTALLLCLFLWLILRNRYGKRDLNDCRKMERKAGDIGLLLTIAALFMSTRYFPWDRLSSGNELLAALVGTLQFPTRLTTIVTISGVFTACVMAVWTMRESAWFLPGRTVLLLIMAVSLLFGTYQLNDILFTSKGPVRLYSAQNMGSTTLLEAEYLPQGAELSHFASYHDPVFPEGVRLQNYEKNGLDVTADITTDREAWIELPMLYYKGYRAEVQRTGKVLTVEKGDNCDVRVLLPEGFSGTIRVWYAGMWYWRVAEMSSIVVTVGFLIWLALVKLRRDRFGKIANHMVPETGCE